MSLSDWQKYELGETGRIVTGRTPPTADKNNFGGQVPFITPSDMDDRKFISKTQRCVAERGLQAVRGCFLPEHSVMVSCIGSDMGKIAINVRPCVTNQQINSIIPNENFDANFLYYSLKPRKNELQVLATSGSAQPILNKGHFSKITIHAPCLLDQKAISKLLCALDDKIEMNRRMNATLEAMARALFKSWFVDFDPVRAKMEGKQPFGMDAATAALFPSRLTPSPLGDIPEGWTTGELKDVIKQANERVNPNKYTASIPYVPIECISPKSIFLTNSESGQNAQSSLITFRKGDILFGAMRPYFHKVCLAPFDGVTRTTAFVLKPIIPDDLPFCLFRMFNDKTILYATNNSEGSTIPYAKWNASLERMPIILPSENIRKTFGNIVAEFLEKGMRNAQEGQSLAKMRDYLLPKLISGDIRIPNVEKFMEVA